MYTLDTSETGGAGTFASVGAVYNELAQQEPELLAMLFQDDWPLDR